DEMVPIPKVEWASIEQERSRLQEIMEAAGLPPDAPSEDFTRLVRDLASISDGQDFSQAMQEAQDEIENLRNVQDDLRQLLTELDADQPEEIASQLASQAQTISDLETQKAQLVEQL